MQYTLRNVPKDVDRALRERAREEGKSLNEVALAALARSVGSAETAIKHRDLTNIAGTWVPDPEVEAALEDQRRVDPELWR